jgi:branched-chain amino acid aminotransferase
LSEKVNINGEIQPIAEATIPVMDHGFLFGDSVYETLRAYQGRFFRFDAHFDRLRNSADGLELELPLSGDEFLERCKATVTAADEPDAAVRIVVTRGVGPMHIDPIGCNSPNVLVFARPRPRYPEGAYTNGLGIAIVERRRNAKKSLDPNVKSGNYLNNVLALVEARKVGAFEGIMCNAEGYVAEGTTSNLFLVKDGVLRTAPLSVGLLSGITRRTVLELAEALAIPLQEERFTASDLRDADEAFITSSLKQVMPVTRIDELTLSDGRRGPITGRLLEGYRALVQEETGVEPEADA